MCRGRCRYFSTYTSPFPNAESASERASWKARAKSSASSATRIPFPPPPAAALMITGNPIFFAKPSASSTSSTGPGVPGTTGNAHSGHRFPRRGLVAHHADLLRCGPDERDVRRGARLGELGVLGEESVAGVDRVGAADLGGGDQPRNAQVRVARRRGTDAHIIVGEAHVQRLAVGLGVHGHRLDAEFLARADHAERDLSAVRDEDLLEHLAWPPGAAQAEPSRWKSSHDVSLDASTPCTRNANSLGLLA